jgi:hypothetical protein
VLVWSCCKGDLRKTIKRAARMGARCGSARKIRSSGSLEARFRKEPSVAAVGAEHAGEVRAVTHLKRMRGGTQSQLLRGSDGSYYIVKFINNPQGARILANELLVTRLAESLQLPVAQGQIVTVTEELIDTSAEMMIEHRSRVEQLQAGRHFGSRCALMPGEGAVYDVVPTPLLSRVHNLETFAGMLVLDKWVGNQDFRQAVFWKRSTEKSYTATFIDHGFCFGGAEWNLSAAPRQGVYHDSEAYREITGLECFEPWFGRIERLPESEIYRFAQLVPPEWYNGEWEELERLLEALIARRNRLGELLVQLRDSSREIFPNWKRPIPFLKNVK